ncbi:MAG: fibronectin type III domain-containing protein [Deltaproteobacteria bacterium]|nr:fibronectin type III domain-containing protein [Deltaproteobacteria bacterium]
MGLAPVRTALAAQASLAWDPSPDPDVTGYRVYFGKVSRAQTESVDVGNAMQYTLTGLLEGTTYYFAATAYDRYGRESVFSNEVSTTTSSSCTYAISPASQSFTAAAGSGTVTVTATAGCSWTATEAASWVTITSGASGTGNGTVRYTVAANTGAARSATMAVAGRSFTISQAAGACTYAISPASQTFAAAAGSGTVAVTATAGCSWTATAGDINNDEHIDITDAVLVMQIMSQIMPAQSVYKEASVNSFNRIGMGDLIYIMQCIATIRTCK